MDLIRSKIDLERRVQVMGILNLTPDSFSDGGAYFDRSLAIARALEIEAEGADILDAGGESTRPGSKTVSAAEEMDRVIPVLEALRGQLRIPISIDTTKAAVAAEAIRAGAELINDVSGLRFDPQLAAVAAETGAGLVLMHSRGTPETMQQIPPAEDIFSEVLEGLSRSVALATAAGVQREKLILDPGIGFGKTPQQNLQLIDGLWRIAEAFHLPVLLGTSRKSFIPRTLDTVTGTRVRDDRLERRAGTAASTAIGVLRGARLVRVHDVAEMVAVTRMSEEILRQETGSQPPVSATIRTE